MKKLISKEERIVELLRFGFPEVFIENIGNITELSGRVENVDGAYFYLPKISNYQILNNQSITPIFDSGESFYVLATNDNSARILHFELENDEIYTDYGKNWKLLLMDIMSTYFDDKIDDYITVAQFVDVGSKIGFKEAEGLFKLKNLALEDYNARYDDHEKWRIALATELGIL